MSNIDIYEMEEHNRELCKSLQKEVKNGLKYDDNKAPYHLLPLDVLEPLVRIYEFGTHKYVENSWREFEPTQQNFNRIYSALMRHLAEWQKEMIKGNFATDEESGQPTMAHVMWNAVMLMYLEQKKKANGDNI